MAKRLHGGDPGGSAESGGSGGGDSVDSGYDEYDEDYSHIITESSAPDLVRGVEDAFKPVELPELLVITGRACARILSGYQKTKGEEAAILEKLRTEGLLAIPQVKNANSLGFTVIDADAVKESEQTGKSAGAFEPSQFMPSRTIEKMERRRNVSIRTT